MIIKLKMLFDNFDSSETIREEPIPSEYLAETAKRKQELIGIIILLFISHI